MENILILPGDGIGPEVMGEVARIIDWFGTHKGLDVSSTMTLSAGVPMTRMVRPFQTLQWKKLLPPMRFCWVRLAAAMGQCCL